jgi:hypothetical protein
LRMPDRSIVGFHSGTMPARKQSPRAWRMRDQPFGLEISPQYL